MNGFVDKREIEDFLRVVETGSDYLDSLITDENCNDPLAWAVQGYITNVSEKLEHIRKVLGEWPALLDQRHPSYHEMYVAVERIANEKPSQELEQRRVPAKRSRRAAEPLLLVPERPEELPN